ncbi:response regulator [uncultured Phenylobacterium sp.]|uniref:response regulator n=1 Tax=uncultured Phenylobacterium sp. TaxID=349273 RepID=UPI0025EB288F|nr:response regulator [uncultured Phenylobacterium sp.]
MFRILYVEDDVVLQLDGEASLLAAGYDVVLASDGPSACACLRDPGASFDGLITDIDLGGALKGWEVADVGRALTARLSVVYVTGAAGHDFLSMGVPHSLMVPKPFTWAAIVSSLSGLMAAAA